MNPREQRLAWFLAGAATASALMICPLLVACAAIGWACWASTAGSETRAPVTRAAPLSPMDLEA